MSTVPFQCFLSPRKAARAIEDLQAERDDLLTAVNIAREERDILRKTVIHLRKEQKILNDIRSEIEKGNVLRSRDGPLPVLISSCTDRVIWTTRPFRGSYENPLLF